MFVPLPDLHSLGNASGAKTTQTMRANKQRYQRVLFILCEFLPLDQVKTTHHAASGIQLAVRYAAEISAAASVVLGTVSHGPKRVQQDLQTVEG